MTHSGRVLAAGLVTAGLVGLLVGDVVAGQISPAVGKRLRGRLIVSDAPLATGGQKVKAALKTINAAHKTTLTPSKKDGGVNYYAFHWTAFMRKKPRVSSLSLEFYKKEGKKKFASGMSANKGLQGVNPSLTILRGHTEISEDDGVTTGKTYKIKLVATIGSRDHLLAQTVVTFK